jgi:hypothetical protein
MSTRIGAATPDDLLLRTWDLVHRAQRFPAVQAPLMRALQEIARALRPTGVNPGEASELVLEDGSAGELLLA